MIIMTADVTIAAGSTVTQTAITGVLTATVTTMMMTGIIVEDFIAVGSSGSVAGIGA
jgi:hypothetical protein